MPDNSLDSIKRLSLKISGIKNISRSSEETVIGHSHYQPNFVLVESVKPSVTFSDFITNVDQTKLAYVIVSSIESLHDLILNSNAILTCILSVINQAINNAIYQTYLLTHELYGSVVSLPSTYRKAHEHVADLITIFSTVEGRELWWIDAKIEYKKVVKKFDSVVSSVTSFFSKFYLACIVATCLLLTNTIAIIPSVGTGTGFLSTFIDNNSFSSSAQVESEDLTTGSILGVTTAQAAPQIKRVFEYTIKEGDTLDKISTLFGLNIETIQFNNEETEIQAGNKLYVPWGNGYLHVAPSEISLEDISKLYSVEQSLIESENIDVLQEGVFAKDAQVLIPISSEPGQVKTYADAFKAEQEREENLRKAAEQAKISSGYSRANTISQNAQTYKGTTAPQAEGFIWPTSGTISRCVQPGHVACDIANASGPALFAVQEGVITQVSYFQVFGYGLMVKIDHGNGISTLYAHMSEIYVTPGQRVAQGEAIGRMGCTGICTGTHVHFEVIVNGRKENPLLYLP